jgi:hypothetical protein
MASEGEAGGRAGSRLDPRQWPTARRVAAAVVTIAGTALVGAVVNDLYGRLADDSPETRVTAVVESAADLSGRTVHFASLRHRTTTFRERARQRLGPRERWLRRRTHLLPNRPGDGSDAVVLHDLRVVGLQEELAPEEPVYLTKCSGAVDLFARRFDVNLDTALPESRHLEETPKNRATRGYRLLTSPTPFQSQTLKIFG